VTTPAVTIDSARPTDHARLSAIQRAVLSDPSPALLTAALDGAALALVARYDRPVGYVLALTPGAVAYVPELAVDTPWQRRGIGTRLLGSVRDRAAATGAEELRLTVRAGDDEARAFYRDRGFEVLERVPDHYETGSGTGLLLRRPL